jgi:hypothetical protein
VEELEVPDPGPPRVVQQRAPQRPVGQLALPERVSVPELPLELIQARDPLWVGGGLGGDQLVGHEVGLHQVLRGGQHVGDEVLGQ